MSYPRLLPTLALALAATGCFGPPPAKPFEEPGTTTTPPPAEPPPPGVAVYVRGSLQPLYQLTPRTEYGRFTLSGVTMKDADFISTANNFVTAAQKLDEIGAQIARERGGTTLDLIPRPEDRQRAQQIPFRGNPSDVDIVRVNGRRKAYIPLGGDLMTPGNEVAAVDLDTRTVTRIKTGIRPQRIAIHPAGLVFVCNQYSNYITIIDPRTDQVMRNATGPIEIKSEFYCADLAFVPRDPAAPDDDKQDLYVANAWRGSVLKYGLTVARDGLSNEPIDVRVTDPAKPSPESQPAAEITGVGANPYRLSLSQDRRALYVANNRGGELARIELGSNNVKRIAVNGPVPDVVQVNDVLLVPTTTLDRGLPDRADQTPQQISAAPVSVKGLDGGQQIAHPGTLHDGTKAYNFEDLRNGMLTVDAQLSPATPPVYFTDDISPERNFAAAQKILQGALPQAVVVNAARTRAWIALSGSDSIQELSVRAGAFRLADAPGPLFHTAERPFALALDESRSELLAASWGGEVLEVFDMNTGAAKVKIDLGYATADYPATTMERGEYFFYNAAWSNNGRKSCASCHFDELLVDGVGYANGASSAGTYHKVPANFNLMTTDSYFWNGSFSTGSYASLASDFQTRTNCELILFGMTEGMTSDPATRVGDPANRIRNGQDAQCRPDTSGPGILPNNFDTIASVIAAQKIVKDQVVRAATGRGFNDVARETDFYSVSELRLPPNPLAYLAAKNQLGPADKAKLEQGRMVFTSSGCGTCHDPSSTRHPYTDGLEHGSGAGWVGEFIDTYALDPRITSVLGSIPQAMVEAYSGSTADREINIHLDPVDYFIPACFDVTKCLVFEDPLAVRGNFAAESERLDALVKINLANADRGFVPGNVRGQPRVNTPSLRGIWFQTNFLRHGLAHTLKEAVLAPGHPLLGDGERGYAIDALGQIDVHGVTSKLSAADFDALYQFVQSIE
jgi:hypothetical protein